MAEQIQIEVTLDGAEQAARGAENVASGLEDMARSGVQTAQRVAAVAGAVQGLVSQLGSRDRTAGLVASVAATSAQFAQLGAMFGPQGVIIGGLVGMTGALAALVVQQQSAAETASEAAARFRDLADAAIAARNAARTAADISAAVAEGGALGGAILSGYSSTELLREEETRRQHALDLTRQIGEAEAENRSRREAAMRTSGRLGDFGGPALIDTAAMRQQLDAINAEIEAIGRARTARADEEAVTSSATATLVESTAVTEREAAAHGRAATAIAEHVRSLEELMQAALGPSEREQFVSMLEGIADEEAAMREDLAQMNADFDAAELERAQELKDEQVRLLEERTAAEEAEREKRQAIAEEENESRTKLAEANEARASEMMENFGSLASGSSKLITSALIDTISGAKTAEEAFTGMLKSFLEMISEYAALKAATEFAEAIGSFARYDFSGGAQHVAAGLAFTAVAVATGVGAAAISTGAPAAPARPATGGGEGRGGEKQTVVVNYNSPVVTAQTEAELGRSIGGMVDTGRRRFGS